MSKPCLVRDHVCDFGPLCLLPELDGKMSVFTSSDMRPSSWDEVCEFRDEQSTMDVLQLKRPSGKSNNIVPWINMPTTFIPTKAFTSPRPQSPQTLLPYQCYFGGLHRHTDMSICARGRDGETEFAWRFERDILHTDFASLTDHSRNLDLFHLARQLKYTAFYHREDSFVTLPGYEWNKTKAYGDCTLHWFNEDEQDLKIYICGDPNDAGGSPEKLDEQLGNDKALFIPHHTADLNHYFRWEFFVPHRSPVVEIFQDVRGCCLDHDVAGVTLRGHTTEAGHHVHEALDAGHQIGFVSGADHRGVAVTGLWAESNSRDGIYQAIRASRTFATTGIQAPTLFLCNNQPMGQSCDPPGKQHQMQVHSTSPLPITSLTLVRNGHDVHTETLHTTDLNWQATWPTADDDQYFYIRLGFEDGNLIWSSPVWIQHHS